MIYWNPSMDVRYFNHNHWIGLLDKVLKEEKNFLDDFNISLLNYNEHKTTNDFLDSLTVSSLRFYILQPNMITPRPL